MNLINEMPRFLGSPSKLVTIARSEMNYGLVNLDRLVTAPRISFAENTTDRRKSYEKERRRADGYACQRKRDYGEERI